MAKKQDELVKPNSALATVPPHMQAYAGQGTESIPKSDVEIPRLKLLQALSPECNDHNDARPGTFWHSILEQSAGRSTRIVPVYVDQSFILWRPRDMGGGILARAADGIHWSPDHGVYDVTLPGGRKVQWTLKKTVASSGLAEWGTMDPDDPNSPPAATRMYNIVAMFPDLASEFSPAVVTLQRSSIAVARKFLGKLKISQAPSFGQLFTMESMKDQNNQGQEFFNFKFTMAGFVESVEDFERYKAIYEQFKAAGLQVKDLESLQEDDPAPKEPTAY